MVWGSSGVDMTSCYETSKLPKISCSKLHSSQSIQTAKLYCRLLYTPKNQPVFHPKPTSKKSSAPFKPNPPEPFPKNLTQELCFSHCSIAASCFACSFRASWHFHRWHRHLLDLLGRCISRGKIYRSLRYIYHEPPSNP